MQGRNYLNLISSSTIITFDPVCVCLCVKDGVRCKGKVMLYGRWLHTQSQRSCWSINSQSSVTFRDKHCYNIYDSFLEDATCVKLDKCFLGEMAFGVIVTSETVMDCSHLTRCIK